MVPVITFLFLEQWWGNASGLFQHERLPQVTPAWQAGEAGLGQMPSLQVPGTVLDKRWQKRRNPCNSGFLSPRDARAHFFDEDPGPGKWGSGAVGTQQTLRKPLAFLHFSSCEAGPRTLGLYCSPAPRVCLEPCPWLRLGGENVWFLHTCLRVDLTQREWGGEVGQSSLGDDVFSPLHHISGSSSSPWCPPVPLGSFSLPSSLSPPPPFPCCSLPASPLLCLPAGSSPSLARHLQPRGLSFCALLVSLWSPPWSTVGASQGCFFFSSSSFACYKSLCYTHTINNTRASAKHIPHLC